VDHILIIITEEITKKTGLTMSWQHYLQNIKLALKVKLIGWPIDIPFINPSRLGTVDRIRRIRDAVRKREIHWVLLSEDEIEDVEEEVAQGIADGTLSKRRRQRSDTGKKRKGRGKKGKKAVASVDERSEEEDESSEEEDEDAEPICHRVPMTTTNAAAPIDLGTAPAMDLDFDAYGSLGFPAFGENPDFDAEITALLASDSTDTAFPPTIMASPMASAAAGRALGQGNFAFAAPVTPTLFAGPAKKRATKAHKNTATALSESAAGTTKKPRKQRSDKGVKRAPKAKENETPAVRAARKDAAKKRKNA
jgi:hypothetical protein